MVYEKIFYKPIYGKILQTNKLFSVNQFTAKFYKQSKLFSVKCCQTPGDMLEFFFFFFFFEKRIFFLNNIIYNTILQKYIIWKLLAFFVNGLFKRLSSKLERVFRHEVVSWDKKKRIPKLDEQNPSTCYKIQDWNSSRVWHVRPASSNVTGKDLGTVVQSPNSLSFNFQPVIVTVTHPPPSIATTLVGAPPKTSVPRLHRYLSI